MKAGRTLGLIALGAATALAGAAAWVARDGLKALALERRAASATVGRLASARQLLPEIEKRELYGRQTREAIVHARELGFDPTAWAERRITRVAGPLTRGEASELLRQIGAGGGRRLFAADSFDLAASSPNAGLFTPPEQGDQGFHLAVNGTLYFPMVSKP